MLQFMLYMMSGYFSISLRSDWLEVAFVYLGVVWWCRLGAMTAVVLL